MSGLVQHADWCLPRPGQDEPRVERYIQNRMTDDGERVAARVLTVRCVECGVATYDGERRD